MVRTATFALVLFAGARPISAVQPTLQPVSQGRTPGRDTTKYLVPVAHDTAKYVLPAARSPTSAEERLADYTRMLTLLTGVLAFATLLLWWTTWMTLKHLGRESEAEHRPWIPHE